MNVGSKLTAVKTAVTSKAGRTLLKGRKASPEVLFVVGLGGVVTSTVLACRATLKVHEINEKVREDQELAIRAFDLGRDDYTQKDFRQDMVVIHLRRAGEISKLYSPAIVVGILSVGFLMKSHSILNQRNASLVAAYTLLDKGFNEYRERVLAAMGPEKEREFRYGMEDREIVEETKNGPKVSSVKAIKDGSIYAKLFDRHNANWSPQPEYNMLFLRCQQTYANDLLKSRGHVMLNDVYDALGMDRTPAGAVVGWIYESDRGDGYIDFGIFNGERPDSYFDFVTGREGAIWLDFNVDGVVYDKI